MPLTCIAIDDEPLALELISTYVSRIPNLQLLEVFEDAISGAAYLEHKTVDLLFLDIQMPDISGLDLAKSLKKKPMIIFTTAHKQFAFEGFEQEAVDYLLKPVNFKKFMKATEKAATLKNYKSSALLTQEDAFFYVHSEYRMVKILMKDIEYIESLEDYIKIHLEHQKPVLSLLSLKKTMLLLPAEQFIRIHRSYIVPVSRVKSIQHKKIQLSTVVLPIGESYAAQVRVQLSLKQFPSSQYSDKGKR
ncbi:LytR/AlgR family response regulator transcription factor [Pedobacter immunditicola]|uniref:LytR/AlgR family response regulator transcription factor n=1 Tax=Pedobacter immunditicola TaxID=3133440 RepID=UPI0030B18A31